MSVESPHRRLNGCRALALLVATTSANTALACDLALVKTPGDVHIAYDPFSAEAASGLLALELANTSEKPCEVELALQDRQDLPIAVASPGDSGVEIVFRPRSPSGLTSAREDRGVYRLTLQPKSSARAELGASVEVDAIPRSGEYVQELQLALRSTDASLGAPTPFRLVLSSPPRAQVNVAGSAAAFGSGGNVDVIDFGEAGRGKTVRAFLQVRANDDARVTFTSQNGGVMKRLEKPEEAPPIAYELRLDGDAIDLSRPTTREVAAPLTLQGTSLEMQFRLTEVGRERPGKYEDLIEIDISPR